MVAKYLVSPQGRRRAHPTIGAALAAAAARGRPALIEIAPGRYEETLTVQGDVQLVAAEGPGSVVVSRTRGSVLDTYGSVRAHGLVFVGRDAGVDAVGCHVGTLTLEHCEVRAHGAVGVHARPNTFVTVRDSAVLYGRAVFTGSGGLVERCRFTDAADNAVAVVEGAHVAVRDSWIGGSRIHGVRVSDARAEVTGCELTGTGQAALAADTRAELTVADCVVNAVHAEAILFIEQSKGSVDRVRVTDALRGIGVASGADPVVRASTFIRCRDTGINVETSGRGRFEGCEIFDAGNVAVLSTDGGAPEVHGCRVSGGNVGIAVTARARGRFTRTVVEDLTSVALRVREESRAVFEDVRVERCASGLETQGNGGTTADVTGAVFRDCDMAAAGIVGQSRATLRDVTVERALLGFGVCEDGQLFVHDCRIKDAGSHGVAATHKARLVARGLTVTGSEGTGLYGKDSAHLNVSDGEFTDCARTGMLFEDTCVGRVVDCSVSGTRGQGVLHNGRVDLVSLRTSLAVVQQDPEAGPTPVVNHFNGPVFNDVVHNPQMAWNNENVSQRQNNEDVSEQQDNEDGLPK